MNGILFFLREFLRSLTTLNRLSLSVEENFKCLIEAYAPAAMHGGSDVVKIKPEAKLLIKSIVSFLPVI